MIKRITAKGICASPGIAIGKLLILNNSDMCAFKISIPEEKLNGEIERFNAAVKLAKFQISKIREKTSISFGDKHEYLFDAQLLLLDDEMLTGKTIRMIKKERVNSEWALESTLKEIRKLFESLDNGYFSERVGDVDDVVKRVLLNLIGNLPTDLSSIEHDTILAAHRLTPSEAALINRDKVSGFVTDTGGKTSHTAIIARSLGIPAVVGLHDFSRKHENGSVVIIDGSEGQVIVHPNPGELSEYRKRKNSFEIREKELHKIKELPAETIDGHKIKLLSNIEFPHEITFANDLGSEGVGLYRSEFLFLKVAPNLPNENDHLAVYSRALDLCGDREVTIRTFDLGGEKFFHSVINPGQASNPILGLRAVRFCAKNDGIFEIQLRAILKASAAGRVRLLIPMITNLEEVRTVKNLLDKVKNDLRKEGASFDENIPFGIMIEVPSAAYTADILASEVDFFSVGTNDLIQYLLAIERGNEDVAYLYDPLHPAVLRTLNFVAESAKKHNIGLNLCGEMASDPLYALVLMGMGYKEFSMNPSSIPHIKNIIRQIKMSSAENMMCKIWNMKTGREVHELVASHFHGLI